MKFLLVTLTSLFASCGVGDLVKDEKSESSESSGPVSFVSGTYSLKSGGLAFTCTNGNKGELDPAAFNNRVVFTDPNVIEITDLDESDGVTVSGFSGLTETDGSFMARQSGDAFDSDAGNLDVTYIMTGKFTNEETWSGTYQMTIYFNDLETSCDYKANFSGSRVSD